MMTPSSNTSLIIYLPLALLSIFHFRCIICLHCKRAIDAVNLIQHIHSDLPLVDLPEDLLSSLQNTYSLVSCSSIICKPGAISPIFGLPLEPNPIQFCDCGKGYSTFHTLRTHQTRLGDRACSITLNNPGSKKIKVTIRVMDND